MHFKLNRWGENFLMQTQMKYLSSDQKLVPETNQNLSSLFSVVHIYSELARCILY
jgi:hypothetical protein